MQEFTAFLVEQWMLSGAALVIFALLVKSFLAPMVQGYKTVKPAEAIELINRNNALVLDIRTENEFHNGHIVNATHVPLEFIDKRINEIQKSKTQPIILVCQSGNRASQGVKILRKHGFEMVCTLNGGIMAWQHANLPLTKKK